MNFKEALKKLNIEDYEKRIFNSNSHGELFHLQDYIILAENIKEPDLFREWFEEVVEDANENWNRSKSIYQYILKIAQQEVY